MVDSGAQSPSVSGRDVQVAPARVLGLHQVQMPSSLPDPDEIPRGRDMYARDSTLPMDGLAHLGMPLCNALLLHLQVAARRPVSNAIAFPGSRLTAMPLRVSCFGKGGPSHHGPSHHVQCGVALLLRCRLHPRPARLGSTFARGPRPSPAGYWPATPVFEVTPNLSSAASSSLLPPEQGIRRAPSEPSAFACSPPLYRTGPGAGHGL